MRPPVYLLLTACLGSHFCSAVRAADSLPCNFGQTASIQEIEAPVDARAPVRLSIAALPDRSVLLTAANSGPLLAYLSSPGKAWRRLPSPGTAIWAAAETDAGRPAVVWAEGPALFRSIFDNNAWTKSQLWRDAAAMRIADAGLLRVGKTVSVIAAVSLRGGGARLLEAPAAGPSVDIATLPAPASATALAVFAAPAGPGVIYSTFSPDGRPARLWLSRRRPSGGWEPPREIALPEPTAMPVLSPGSLDASSDSSGLWVVVRGSAVYLLHSLDGSTWSPPRRLSPYGALAASGRTVTLVSGPGVVWIDARFERGVDASALSRVWSDSYPGWGITSVFAESLACVDRSSAPQLIGPREGFQSSLIATEAAGTIHLAWAGRPKVKKAASNASETSDRIFYTVIQPFKP